MMADTKPTLTDVEEAATELVTLEIEAARKRKALHEMIKSVAAGKVSKQALAEAAGVSRQRVHQIVNHRSGR
jgi:hypothetical protein